MGGDGLKAMRTPPIRGIVEVSLTHWVGRICSVVYVGGCTLRCRSCPAPHLIARSAGSAPDKSSIPLDAVLDAIYRRRRWIEGVVVKGGEPLARPELEDLLELFRDFSLLVRVETNGTRPDALRDLIRKDLVDFVALDLKAPLDERYHDLAGTTVDLAAIFESIGILLSGEVEHEFRTAVYDDRLTEDDILTIARTIRGADRFVLRSVAGRGPGRGRLRRVAQRASRHVKACHVDGRPQDRESERISLATLDPARGGRS
jgi:pyruvate formate lyase activating enzyme